MYTDAHDSVLTKRRIPRFDESPHFISIGTSSCNSQKIRIRRKHCTTKKGAHRTRIYFFKTKKNI